MVTPTCANYVQRLFTLFERSLQEQSAQHPRGHPFVYQHQTLIVSPLKASTVIPCGIPTRMLSKSVVCAGSRVCCWCPSPGLTASGRCPF